MGKPLKRPTQHARRFQGSVWLQAVRADLHDSDFRSVVIFISTAVLLALYFYFAQPSFFDKHLAQHVAPGEWKGIYRYVWWSMGGVVLRMLVPLSIIWLVLRERPREYGYRIKGTVTWKHAKIYIVLYLLILPVLYGVSLTEAFQNKYPFYKGAIQGWDHFLLFEISYLFQFVALEAFFRGYLIFGLRHRFGFNSLFIMAIPYCMIHFGKPLPETIGAIGAGLLLGYLALKSGTFWFGVILHWAVGLTMDLLAMAQRT